MSSDVYDPTDLQINWVRSLSTEELTVSDLAKKPEAIELLLRQHTVILYDLKSCQGNLTECRNTNEELKNVREKLRVELAALHERANVSLIEIPISMASGFAINILTSNPASILGLALLILSLFMLVFLRWPQVISLFTRLSQRTSLNEEKP